MPDRSCSGAHGQLWSYPIIVMEVYDTSQDLSLWILSSALPPTLSTSFRVSVPSPGTSTLEDRRWHLDLWCFFSLHCCGVDLEQASFLLMAQLSPDPQIFFLAHRSNRSPLPHHECCAYNLHLQPSQELPRYSLSIMSPRGPGHQSA